MEKHLETDEVFVLLTGKCVLLIQTAEDKIALCPMEQGKVYCIPKGVWHNTIVSKNAKMVLIENRNTSGENSQVFDLSPEQLSGLKQELGSTFNSCKPREEVVRRVRSNIEACM